MWFYFDIMWPQTNQHSDERKEYEGQIMMLKTQLENEEIKRAMSNSEMEIQIQQLGQEKAELNRKVESKVKVQIIHSEMKINNFVVVYTYAI